MRCAQFPQRYVFCPASHLSGRSRSYPNLLKRELRRRHRPHQGRCRSRKRCSATEARGAVSVSTARGLDDHAYGTGRPDQDKRQEHHHENLGVQAWTFWMHEQPVEVCSKQRSWNCKPQAAGHLMITDIARLEPEACTCGLISRRMVGGAWGMIGGSVRTLGSGGCLAPQHRQFAGPCCVCSALNVPLSKRQRKRSRRSIRTRPGDGNS